MFGTLRLCSTICLSWPTIDGVTRGITTASIQKPGEAFGVSATIGVQCYPSLMPSCDISKHYGKFLNRYKDTLQLVGCL